MEKTEMMKRYEAETGKYWSVKLFVVNGEEQWWVENRERNIALCMSRSDAEHIVLLEAKAEAYDRLMSGGKKTLKEWANIFGMPVAMDKNLSGIVFDEIPELLRTVEAWRAPHGYVGKIPSCNIYFTGSWQDSLTLPDGWEETCSSTH